MNNRFAAASAGLMRRGLLMQRKCLNGPRSCCLLHSASVATAEITVRDSERLTIEKCGHGVGVSVELVGVDQEDHLAVLAATEGLLVLRRNDVLPPIPHRRHRPM